MHERTRRWGGMVGGPVGFILLQACPGPDPAFGPTGATGPAGLSTASAVFSEEPGDDCSAGGVRVGVGTDRNRNGTLEPAEVEEQQYVCNGVGDASAAVVTGQHFDALPECPTGGVLLSMGHDDGEGGGTARNGVLEPGEVDDTSVVCDGPAGAAGDAGVSGPVGATGGDGATGATGIDGIAGATGPAGPEGATGADGATGPTGATGQDGATGPTGTGGEEGLEGFDGLVAYASGAPIEITTVAGATDVVALPAFGSWASFDTNGNLASIDLTGAPGVNLDTAFIVPADGTITRISAFMSTTVSLNLEDSIVEYGVALYAAPPSSNTFEPLLDSVANFTPLTGVLGPGNADQLDFSPAPFPILVTAGTRILMVVAASASGASVDNTLAGYFNGSVQFEETAAD